MNGPKILAIDPATKCGWAYSGGTSGVWNFEKKANESNGTRLMKFRKKVIEFYNTYGFELVAYEEPRGFGHHVALVAHAEFQGIIKEVCESLGVEFKGYRAKEIKKYATGSANADKHDMIGRAEFKFKIPIIDDNHADALWILDLAKKEFHAPVATDSELPGSQ